MNEDMISFLCRAKKATYAGHGAEAIPSRPSSHDLIHTEGALTYIDSYLGGERFSGEEALWQAGQPVWAMNYTGRVTAQPFSGDFLKEALVHVSKDIPYRGPSYYTDGIYEYVMTVEGDISWFHGYEKITLEGRLIYDLYFHGGTVI